MFCEHILYKYIKRERDSFLSSSSHIQEGSKLHSFPLSGTDSKQIKASQGVIITPKPCGWLRFLARLNLLGTAWKQFTWAVLAQLTWWSRSAAWHHRPCTLISCFLRHELHICNQTSQHELSITFEYDQISNKRNFIVTHLKKREKRVPLLWKSESQDSIRFVWQTLQPHLRIFLADPSPLHQNIKRANL